MLEMLFTALAECWFFLSYVTGQNAFPQRLSAKEEAACIARMREGNGESEEAKRAQRTLIEHNLRLVAHVARKYRRTGMENDDLISIGTIGLMKAVRTYVPETGNVLATYAARCIENEILMALRAGKKHRREVSMQEAVGADKEGNEITLLEILGSDGDEIELEAERRANAQEVRGFVEAVLTPRERTVIERRYGLDGRPPQAQREVAQALGISRSYVSRIEKKALEALREAYRLKNGNDQ